MFQINQKISVRITNKNFVASPNTMTSSKETMREDKKSEKIEICQTKPVPAVNKRKLLDVPVSEVKHIKLIEEKPVVQDSVCAFCTKKLKFISTFTCRCLKSFCTKHRFHDQHLCTYDYKAEAKQKLKESNPKIVARKITE